jgi:hypothetical protein
VEGFVLCIKTPLSLLKIEPRSCSPYSDTVVTELSDSLPPELVGTFLPVFQILEIRKESFTLDPTKAGEFAFNSG